MMQPTRQQRRELERQNRAWPIALVQIPADLWPPSTLPIDQQPHEVWRSRNFLVQIFYEQHSIDRMSVCRTSHTGDNWQDNISWDDLQRLKSECGRGAKDAIEIYPADIDIVNVANMRHLWVMPAPISFAWRKERQS